MLQSCALCETLAPTQPIVDGDRTFCCAGCHAVFNILATKNSLTNYREHPLFLQALRSGLISNPALLEEIRRNAVDLPEQEWEKIHLEIQDLWCPSCAVFIRLMLLQERGIRHCVVDYCTDLASIEYAPRHISKEQLYAKIASLGYRPASLQDAAQSPVTTSLNLRFIIAAFCSLNIMMFAYPIYASYFDLETIGYTPLLAWLSFACSVPVLTYCAWPIWRRCLNSLQVGLFGMEALVAIGVAAATAVSAYELFQGGSQVYFDSMSVIVVLVLLGKIIEAKAKFSAKECLLRLTRSLPRRGRKQFPDCTQRFVPLKEITPGDAIVVLTGEKIVLDGVVTAGTGACDESLMTGESLPILKKAGDRVLGGSLIQQGSLTIRVTAALEETALHRIIEMIEHDIGHKSPYVPAADRIVRWFVPLVIALACVTAGWYWLTGYSAQEATLYAVSVLLISCPCAIGIAAPLAESHLLNGLAKLGAIVRNRGCLPLLGKETWFVFDKTGTVTEGVFTLRSGVTPLSEKESSILKGLASQSIHPVAVALNASIRSPAIQLDSTEEVAGKGLRGSLGHDKYILGSLDFLRQQGVQGLDEWLPPQHDQVITSVYFAKNGVCLTRLDLGDRVRSGARETVASLEPAKTLLLSGDAPSTVEAVAKQCGFDSWQAGCHPLGKREVIDTLRQRGEVVAMLGDGINDAPALTAASIGIAVLSATDVSVQVSDILLTTDRLGVIPEMRSLAQKGARIIKQNLFWAFFYNVVGIALAMQGMLSPIFAAFAMVASSLMVLFNAKRIKS